MKKNLNIAYLNGAEGLVRKAASSGGSGGGEASTIEYLDVSGMIDGTTDEMSVKKMFLIYLSYLTKFVDDNIVQISGGAGLSIVSNNANTTLIGVVAIAINFNAKIIVEGHISTILEFLSNSFTQEELDAIPRITKEEFYSLE